MLLARVLLHTNKIIKHLKAYAKANYFDSNYAHTNPPHFGLAGRKSQNKKLIHTNLLIT
jgi:hypothetical protein